AAGQSGDTSVPLISYDLGGKANHGPGYYESDLTNFAPRVAFAYNPEVSRRTVFRGGFGVVVDHTGVKAVQYQQDRFSYLFQASANRPFGVTSDPVTSLQTDPRFDSITSIHAAGGADHHAPVRALCRPGRAVWADQRAGVQRDHRPASPQ